MLVYRIQKRQHADACLTGEGARRYGGRWNPPGTPLVYAAATPELALLETLVHLDGTPLRKLPPYVQITLELPGNAVETIPLNELPDGWDRAVFPLALPRFLLPRLRPDYPALAFAVPSVVLASSPSRNILINPLHPRSSEVMIQSIAALEFDERLRG